MGRSKSLGDQLRTALLLPMECTDQEIVVAIRELLTDNATLRRRLVEEGTDLYEELAKARKEIAALVAELRVLKSS